MFNNKTFLIFFILFKKPHLAEKLDRLRWCVTEGLQSKYLIAGLKNDASMFNLYPSSVGPVYGVIQSHSYMQRVRSRGPGSKRPVHGSGATLHVSYMRVFEFH